MIGAGQAYCRREACIYKNENGGIMLYVFFFLIGFGLSVTGGVTIIAYMNFLPVGLSYSELLSFMLTRLECYFLPIGIMIMIFVLYVYPNR